MKKFFSLIALILLIAVGLTSCNLNQDSTNQNINTDQNMEASTNNATVTTNQSTVSSNSSESVASGSATSQEASPARKTVSLTKDNYQQYISIHVQSITNELDRVYCGYNFVGSSVCKFNDVKISYLLDGWTTVKTCTLNMSGYGQTDFFRLTINNHIPELTIVDITGTVEILY